MRNLLKIKYMLFFLLLSLSAGVGADHNHFESEAAQKVVYDVKTSSMKEFVRVLNRISYLNTSLGGDPLSTSIIVVLRGNEIEYFARDKEMEHAGILERTLSLTMGDTIEFRICRFSAARRGYSADDLQSFAH